jgi:prevent-host-death family protein
LGLIEDVATLRYHVATKGGTVETVGIRELKNRLSELLRRVSAGDRLIVTDRGKPIAVISPPAEASVDHGIETLIREGLAQWGGGKPRGAARPPRIKGRPVSEIVIEERR